MFRVGLGFDVHAFAEGRPLILGGVTIPYKLGLAGHSDADVLLHAIIDAVLGAVGAGDIGRWFPDTDQRFKDADSAELFQTVWSDVSKNGWALENLDATVIAEEPKLAPYVSQLVERIAALFGADTVRVNVKATTTERLGFTGRKEGIAAQAVVLLTRQQD